MDPLKRKKMTDPLVFFERKYHTLFIGNLTRDVREKQIRRYCERFGPVEDCHLFEINSRRSTAFAFVLMRDPDSIYCLMRSRPHFLDNRRLFLKRRLPEQWPNKFEKFLAADSVFIQMKGDKQNKNTTDFNEESIREYFGSYGTILNFHLLEHNRCLIEYTDYDPVDCLILDSPHFFNTNELLIDKYYAPERLEQIDILYGSNNEANHSRRYLEMRVGCLSDSISSLRLSHDVKLEIMYQGFASTIRRREQLLDNIKRLQNECNVLKEKNRWNRETIDKTHQLNARLESDYQKRLNEERCKQNEWRNKIEQLQ